MKKTINIILGIIFIMGILSCAGNIKNSTIKNSEIYTTNSEIIDIDNNVVSDGYTYWYYVYEIAGKGDEKGLIYADRLSAYKFLVCNRGKNYKFPVIDAIKIIEELYPKFAYHAISFYAQVSKKTYEEYLENKKK